VDEALYSSEVHTWATPWELFCPLNGEFDFTIDVCALPFNAKIPRFWSPIDNALKLPWTNERAWCNPPYGDHLTPWSCKIAREARRAETIVALVPSRTNTEWFLRLASAASEVRFLTRRLTFLEEDGLKADQSSPFPSVLFVFRKEHKGSPACSWWELTGFSLSRVL
jgi:site-specific DNA-methyltransferase (adenine-specific)